MAYDNEKFDPNLAPEDCTVESDALQNDSPLTPRQKANLRNAKKSTGPRTDRGKARSRLNAVKHGLFAADLLSVLSPADAEKFMALVRALVHRYPPSDVVEEILIQQMARGIWGDYRVHRWDFFAVERLAASFEQVSKHGLSTQPVPLDVERLAAYGARFRSSWYKAMTELEHRRSEKLANARRG